MASPQATALSTSRQTPPPRDVNQLTDAELRHIAQTTTAATRARMHRILSEYVILPAVNDCVATRLVGVSAIGVFALTGLMSMCAISASRVTEQAGKPRG